jgi:hypothetical protein
LINSFDHGVSARNIDVRVKPVHGPSYFREEEPVGREVRTRIAGQATGC